MSEEEGDSLVRSPEDLARLRSNLEYELRMVKETAAYLNQHAHRIGESDISAYLESFLLHVMTLVEFYFPPQDRDDPEPSAVDLIPTWRDHVDISESLWEIYDGARSNLGRFAQQKVRLPGKKQIAAVCADLETLRGRFELLLKATEQTPL